MVADMEEDKVADNEEDMVADINIDINILTHSPKSEKCPDGDPCPQMRTRVGRVILCRAILGVVQKKSFCEQIHCYFLKLSNPKLFDALAKSET